MTTIHLSDAQRDTFTACGLIVIDGEEAWAEPFPSPKVTTVAPEGWRILTEPCPQPLCYQGALVYPDSTDEPIPLGPCPDCDGGRRVVTLTATCPECGDSDDPGMVIWPSTGCLTRCDRCEGNPDGVVTLGRFTIPALLPVVLNSNPTNARRPYVSLWRVGHHSYCSPMLEPKWGAAMQFADGRAAPLEIDPVPRPGQFIALPQPVEVGHAANV